MRCIKCALVTMVLFCISWVQDRDWWWSLVNMVLNSLIFFGLAAASGGWTVNKLTFQKTTLFLSLGNCPLMIGTEMVFKMFYSPFNHLTWLLASESFIEFICHENFRYYMVMNRWVVLKGANSLGRWVTVNFWRRTLLLGVSLDAIFQFLGIWLIWFWSKESWHEVGRYVFCYDVAMCIVLLSLFLFCTQTASWMWQCRFQIWRMEVGRLTASLLWNWMEQGKQSSMKQ
jgi:hypothetical protein